MINRSFPLQAFWIGLVAFILAACGSSEGEESARRRGQAKPYPILSVEPRPIVLTSSYPATLEGQQTVEIRPRVQGYIVDIRVDEGDLVNRGQVLFRLNSEDYQQKVRSARADVESAQANVQKARDEVERIKPLVEKDILSEYRLKDARNTLQSRKATLAQRQASLKNAKVNLNYTYVRSPTDGVISEIPYRIGSLVNSTIKKPLTVVSDDSRMYAYFSMSESELLGMNQKAGGEGTLRRGEQRALRRRIEDLPRVNLILADSTKYPHKGNVKLASGLIDTHTGSASFRAVFPNPNRILRSGGTGNVVIPFLSTGSIVIPKSATYSIQDKRFVYQVGKGGVVESVPVNVASLSTKKLFVVKSGLSSGDKIVTEGMGSLKDGAKIKPQLVSADSLYQAMTTKDQKQLAQASGGAQWKRRAENQQKKQQAQNKKKKQTQKS